MSLFQPPAAQALPSEAHPNLNILPESVNQPLNKQYCLYFSLLSQFAAISGIISLLAMIYSAQKYDMKLAALVVSTTLVYFIAYFQNRLLYSMCAKSL